jgi:hypothetical protein
MGGDLIHFYCLQLSLYQAIANDSKNHSFISLFAVQKIKSFFSNGVGSLLAATSLMLCLFLDQNKV